MKGAVLLEMPDNELNDLLTNEKDRLFKMRMSHSVSPLENPQEIKFVKRNIARILTEISRRNKLNKNCFHKQTKLLMYQINFL